ncbi:hypothetical protein BGW41_007076 [Actinomortierella wolfii]|nr:hypothetical protein BGW41_007076 [Actinomortierella wolfii]
MNQPWKASNPPLTAVKPMPQSQAGHSITRVGEMEGTLLVAGGEISHANNNGSPILLYTSQTDTWDVPAGLTKNDTQLIRKSHHAVAVTGKDGALLHGGYENVGPISANPANNTVVSSLITIKPANQFKPLTTAAVSRAQHSPSLARHAMVRTDSGNAIILGGITPTGQPANMTMAYVMNAIDDAPSWRVQPIQGNAPLPRFDFSAVLLNSSTLLVYGGTRDSKSVVDTRTHYLDINSWTWSSPESSGTPPSQGRWGHTATLAFNGVVVIGFGISDGQQPPDEPITLLDTQTNTWITDYTPPTTPISPGGSNGSNDNPGTPTNTPQKKLPFGAVLAIAFLVTIALVGGGFCLLVQRKKRRTRNTLAREVQGDQAPRQALRHQSSFASESSLSRSLRGLFSLGSSATSVGAGRSKRGSGGGSSLALGRSSGRDGIYRMSMQTNPMMVQARLTQRGYSPAKLGYPETVTQQGTGLVQVSAYVYPNQACVETEKDVDDGQETAIVYHSYTQAQKDAIKLAQQQMQKEELAYELPPVVSTTRPSSGLGFYYGSDRRGSGHSLSLSGAGGVGDGGGGAGGKNQGWRKDQQPVLSSPPSSSSLYQSHQQYKPPPPTASVTSHQQQQRYTPPPPSTSNAAATGPVTTPISSPPAIPMATRPTASGRSTAVSGGYQPTLASSPPSHGDQFRGGGVAGQYSHQPLQLNHLEN